MLALRVFAMVLFAAGGMFTQQAPPGIADKISLVTSVHAPGHINRDRLAYAFWLLVREQNLELRPLPSILVLHLSQREAARMGRFSASPILVDHCESRGGSYYQVWLLGQPKSADYLIKLEGVLQHEFRLHQTHAQVHALLSRVASLDSEWHSPTPR